MSISCECDFGGDDPTWWWSSPFDFSTLQTRRARRCCSCKQRIAPGECVMAITRWRDPTTDIEERISGDEVPLASWFMCEECGGVAMAVQETGACFTLDEDIKQQVREFRDNA